MQKRKFFFKNIKALNTNNISLKFLFLLLLIKPTINECDKTTPILKNNSCTLEYCSRDNIKNNICSINNTIVKTQWLNDIKWIGDKFFRYVNLATYSNGDLIVETSSSNGSAKRMFYGIKQDGSPLFTFDGKRTKNITLEVDTQSGNTRNARYYSEFFIAKINGGDNNGKEYLISVSTGNGYAELYDFDDNNKIYQKSSTSFLKFQNDGLRGSSFNYISSDNTYHSLFCFYSDSYFYINRYIFSSIDISNSNHTYYYNTDIIGNAISCFLSNSKKIVCFYTYKDIYGQSYGYIRIINENNEKLGGTNIFFTYAEKTTYLQCIYYKNEIGIFVYYYFINDNNYNKIIPQFPKILFKTFSCYTTWNTKKCDFSHYFNNLPDITLNKRKLILIFHLMKSLK